VFLSKEAAQLSGLDLSGGICALTLGEMRACPDELTLVQDSADHAEIRGVPLKSEDEGRALGIADYLVRIAADIPLE
jgi:hypothetical protein